jgi:hypothetical protein
MATVNYRRFKHLRGNHHRSFLSATLINDLFLQQQNILLWAVFLCILHMRIGFCFVVNEAKQSEMSITGLTGTSPRAHHDSIAEFNNPFEDVAIKMGWFLNHCHDTRFELSY